MCARIPLARAKGDESRSLLRCLQASPSSGWTESTDGSINLLDLSAQLRRQKSNI